MGDVVVDEFVIFSDHHAHPFIFGSKQVLHNNTYYNSRLLESVKVIEQINSYTKENNIKKVIFTGDLFHTRESVPTDAYSITLQAIANLAKQNKVWLLAGNHDFFDKDGLVTSLTGFKYIPNVNVISDINNQFPHSVVGKLGTSYFLHFVPYTEDKLKAKAAFIKAAKQAQDCKRDGPSILFAHQGMQGAKVGSDYVLVSNSDITVSDIDYKQFLGCFFGHFHQHQQLFKNGWYVGASHQHNWGDANTSRGFLHVKMYIDYVDFQFIESRAPRFISIPEDKVPITLIRQNDFVHIQTDRKLTEEQVATVRKQVGTEVCEVTYTPPEMQIAGLDLANQSLSPMDMLSTWVKLNDDWLKQNIPDIDKEDLLDYGRQALTSMLEVEKD